MEDHLVGKCVAIFWAIIGCTCSFLCPLFLGRDDWPAPGDTSSVQLAIMLVSCTAAAVAYRAGYVRRSPVTKRAWLKDALQCWISWKFFMACGASPNTMGLLLLSVAFSVLLEMGYTKLFCLYGAYIPIIADVLLDGWDSHYLTQPVLLTQPLLTIALCWKILQLLEGKMKLEHDTVAS